MPEPTAVSSEATSEFAAGSGLAVEGSSGSLVFTPPPAEDPPGADPERFGTLVYSAGKHLTLVKGKTPDDLGRLIDSAGAANVTFVLLDAEGDQRVWVRPGSVTALVLWNGSGAVLND